MQVQIFTSDLYLGRLLYRLLSLKGYDAVILKDATAANEDAHLRLIDLDTCPDVPVRSRDITLSRKESNASAHAKERRLSVPFLHEALFSLLQAASDTANARKDAPLRLRERTAVLHGREIPLTETEHSLLKTLMEADGAFVSRETLLSCVGSGERGLNVFIHYLRKKLETEGEHVLLCSRAKGYCIEHRFLHP